MKKLIDEKGRLGGKLSVIDLVILLLVLAIVIGAYVQFFVLEQTDVRADVEPIRYTLGIQNVRDWAAHNIRPGDTVFAASGAAVGTVQYVFSEPLEQVVVSALTGEVWQASLPERYTVYVEVSATATVADGRFLVSRTVPMGAGNSPTQFTTRYASFSAFVKEIGLYGE